MVEFERLKLKVFKLALDFDDSRHCSHLDPAIVGVGLPDEG